MMTKRCDCLIVGSGLFGATFAHLARQSGKSCLVIDRRSHVGGNVYCGNIEGINVHQVIERAMRSFDKILEE